MAMVACSRAWFLRTFLIKSRFIFVLRLMGAVSQYNSTLSSLALSGGNCRASRLARVYMRGPVSGVASPFRIIPPSRMPLRVSAVTIIPAMTTPRPIRGMARRAGMLKTQAAMDSRPSPRHWQRDGHEEDQGHVAVGVKTAALHSLQALQLPGEKPPGWIGEALKEPGEAVQPGHKRQHGDHVARYGRWAAQRTRESQGCISQGE